MHFDVLSLDVQNTFWRSKNVMNISRIATYITPARGVYVVFVRRDDKGSASLEDKGDNQVQSHLQSN